MGDALTADEVSLLSHKRDFLASGSDISANMDSRLLESVSTVSTTLVNIPFAITECQLAPFKYTQNKTLEVNLRGAG